MVSGEPTIDNFPVNENRLLMNQTALNVGNARNGTGQKLRKGKPLEIRETLKVSAIVFRNGERDMILIFHNIYYLYHNNTLFFTKCTHFFEGVDKVEIYLKRIFLNALVS